VNVLGPDHAVEHAQAKALACLVQSLKIGFAIARELQQEFSLVATMGEVPDQAVSVDWLAASSRILSAAFLPLKRAL
jgi:hypothetical protein